MMRIHKVRLGHATNSSSTHSLIFLCDRDRDVDDVDDVDCDGQEFGWGYFTAASPEAKRAYFGQILRANLDRGCGAEVARRVASELAGVVVDAAGYVDHQSVPAMPRTWDEGSLDLDFAAEFRDYLLRDGVVVLGGNDNDEREHDLQGAGPRADPPLERDIDNQGVVARKDSHGFWTVFNRLTGAKVRFAFTDSEGGDAVVEPDRADAPELVDVKITGHCHAGCKWCYQDSTARGDHAPFTAIDQVAVALADMRVFEVAIGGGEPTTHPEFPAILRAFHSRGVVPSFTTRSLAWLRDTITVAAVREACRAFGYSVHREADVVPAEQAFAAVNLAPCRPVFQHVVGTLPEDETLALLRAAAAVKRRVVLLGFKTVGRGRSWEPVTNDRWLDLAHEAGLHEVSIDTAFASQNEGALRAAGIPCWAYEVQEGRFSMYVDAVAGRVGPSSYHHAQLSSVADFSTSALLQAFHAFA